MDNTNFLDQSTSLTLVIIVSLIFTFLGLIYSKKYQGLNNYLTANRRVGFFSLSTSFVASALGNLIAGQIAGEFDSNNIANFADQYLGIVITISTAGIILLFLSKQLQKLMGDVE